MSEWKEYRLSDVCYKIGSGATPRGGAESYQSSGEYSLIRSQNVLDFNFTMKALSSNLQRSNRRQHPFISSGMGSLEY